VKLLPFALRFSKRQVALQRHHLQRARMDYGAHLPLIDFGAGSHTLPRLQKYAVAARYLGFRYLAANDHLIFPKPCLDDPTARAAVLSESASMTVATTVALPAVRRPIAFAKAASALDHLSGGRGLPNRPLPGSRDGVVEHPACSRVGNSL